MEGITVTRMAPWSSRDLMVLALEEEVVAEERTRT